jgi:anti-sigma regulatory factor (Ser/Thr protein kinase)
MAELELALPSLPAAVRPMRNAAAELAEAAGFPEKLVYDVRLAVSEAVTNSVRHGSPVGAEIVMSVSSGPGRLTISIRDQGPDAGSESNPGLGLGFPIMSAVATDLQVAQLERGTVVTMIFSWPE